MQKEKEVISRYHRLYNKEKNMTCKEMKDWSDQPCSKKASIGRAAVKRNIKLSCTPLKNWDKELLQEAKKAYSYLKRAKKIKGNNKVKGCNLTKNQIALKNWAFDPTK